MRAVLPLMLIVLLSAAGPTWAYKYPKSSPEVVGLCAKLLAVQPAESGEELYRIASQSAFAENLLATVPAQNRLAKVRVLALKEVIKNFPPDQQSEILRAFFKITLLEIGVLSDPGSIATSLAIIYSSERSVENLFARYTEISNEEILAVASINRLKHTGFQFDLETGEFGIDPKVYEVRDYNVRTFINPNEFVPEDWRLGEAMVHPDARSAWNVFAKTPSDLAKHAMVNRNGRAYLPLRVYDPVLKSFVVREYPVTSLSRLGNPVILIHPRSHIFIPTQTRIEKMGVYGRLTKSLTQVTKSDPVEVHVYGGGDHLGLFTQLIIKNNGHHRAYSAWRRREPLYVEIFAGSSYYDFSITWKTIGR